MLFKSLHSCDNRKWIKNFPKISRQVIYFILWESILNDFLNWYSILIDDSRDSVYQGNVAVSRTAFKKRSAREMEFDCLIVEKAISLRSRPWWIAEAMGNYLSSTISTLALFHSSTPRTKGTHPLPPLPNRFLALAALADPSIAVLVLPYRGIRRLPILSIFAQLLSCTSSLWELRILHFTAEKQMAKCKFCNGRSV